MHMVCRAQETIPVGPQDSLALSMELHLKALAELCSSYARRGVVISSFDR
jgi:hypothetical protein